MTTTKRLRWWSIGNLLFTLLLIGYLAYLWEINILDNEAFGVHQSSQNIQVVYTPGRPDAMISIRLDGLSRYQTVSYDISSTEAWAPHWQATLTGHSSEFVTLNDGWSQAPGPMTRALAERVARSYKLTLNLDGQERVIDFREGGQIFYRSTLRFYKPLRGDESRL